MATKKASKPSKKTKPAPKAPGAPDPRERLPEVRTGRWRVNQAGKVLLGMIPANDEKQARAFYKEATGFDVPEGAKVERQA